MTPILTFIFLYAGLGAVSDEAAAVAEAARQLHAVRLSELVAVDGQLKEAVWTSAPAATAFKQRDPNEGAAPSERTEVRLAYDDDALYVAARMHDSQPRVIVARLGRRDAWLQADAFVVYLDGYHDRRSGLFFSVNAAGTLRDGTLYNDDWDDDTWDGVWEGRARIDDDGWTVEMRIPYSQLRFKNQPDLVFGINCRRFQARTKEDSYLAIRPKKESGFVSRFPELHGITGISPPRRISITPYATTRGDAHDARPGESLQRRVRIRPGARGRRQDRHRQRPHAGRDRQPGLRAGRGRPRGRQSLGRRDLLRREAPVLRRGLEPVQLRLWRRQQLHRLQLPEPGLLLQPPHRPCAPGRPAGLRLPERTVRHHDTGRRQGHRQGRGPLERRDAALVHAARVCGAVGRRNAGAHRDRTGRLLRRRPRAAGVSGQPLRHRLHRHLRAPLFRQPTAARRRQRRFADGRPRRLGLPRSQQELGPDRLDRSQPGQGQHGAADRAAGRPPALFPATRRDPRGARRERDLALRLGGALRAQQGEGQRPVQRGLRLHYAGLRHERSRFLVARRREERTLVGRLPLDRAGPVRAFGERRGRALP